MRFSRLRFAVVAAATVGILATMVSPASAVVGPDAFGYVALRNGDPGAPTFTYTDISGGAPVVTGDDNSVTVATPFPISFYGQLFNSIGISTNGLIDFGGSNTTFSNACLPALQGTPKLFAMWDDLIFGGPGNGVFAQAVGNQFIVQWKGQYFPGSGNVDFEAIFTNGSQDVDIMFNTVSGGGSSSTEGIQSTSGASVLQVACNAAASVAAGNVIRYSLVQQAGAVTVQATTPDAVEGGAPGVFHFTRSGDTSQNLSIAYTLGGTATSGDDYDPPGIVTFPAGQATVDKQLVAKADSVADDGETVIVTLSGGAGYTVGSPSSATVTIHETPPAPDACANAPVSTYTDRNTDDVHKLSIDCITAYGFAEGFPDNTYRPTLNVSRAQMASFVARLLEAAGVTLPSNPPDAYPGDDGDVHELAINQLSAVGVFDDTTGQTGDTFNVSDPMRRDDMAQILVNAYKLVTGSDLPAGPNAFTDDEGNDNEAAINALANAGVVEGTGGGLYDPSGSVSRGQYSSFFARYIQLLVDAGALQPLP